MSVLFALLPAGVELEAALGADANAVSGALVLRRYPVATDARHAFSIVRDGRDRLATRWLRGVVRAMAFGSLTGAAVNAVLSLGFEMFGGLASLAIPLGFALGAFLGAFTAAMTGTHRAREELHELLRSVEAGDTLLQWSGERDALLPLRQRFARTQLID